ncbi:LRR and PYD domains-containing 3-like protein [Labeo rohita]|uniref:LRR and PYD domains-containing 3-like protein n=1 Tax=Labeo rohita TaxID=84645 RepID=A0A498P6Y5_LABRO|nr:LRR and PYD domains-containing 3-like protein [Labeo rohita]
MPVEICPLCLRMYGRLSQHLILTHKVENKEERRLLLAITTGRINARAGNCPILGCGRFSHRLDRHIRTHSEISEVAQDDAILCCKRRVVISKLTALRASNPAVPMVSTLDLEEHEQLEDPDVPPSLEELEAEECSNPECKRQKKFLRSQVVYLNKQVDILTDSLKNVTRRYRMLKRKSTPLGAVRVGQVAQKLLSSLGPEEEDVTEEVLDAPVQTITPGEPSTSQQPEDRAEEPSASKEQTDHVSVLNEILEEYRRHQLGPDPTTKLRENVGCQIYRIKKFIAFMAEGKGKLSDFCFLNETAKLHAWVSSLRKANMTVTTIRHYVMNVGTFFSYIAETPPPSCRLSRNALIGLHREIQSLRKSLKRGIALPRTSEVRVIAKSTLLKCRTQAMQAIPELLTLLEKKPTQKVLWQFYGHFVALLSSIYGHRGGVFQNITIQEVLAAQKSTSQKAYLVNVTSHKTNQAFGPAQIALTEEEYGWVQRFLRLKDQLPGGTEAKYLFFTSTPNPCKNLNNYFQEAWKSMGLPGCPTFTDVRTSIASHAFRGQSSS